MKTITVTRKSKLGFGYTAGCIQGEHGLEVAEVTSPDYQGTIRQLDETIRNDRTLQSFKSGGTLYRTAWFVKIQGQWHKLIQDFRHETVSDLLEKYENKFFCHTVEVELEN